MNLRASLAILVLCTVVRAQASGRQHSDTPKAAQKTTALTPKQRRGYELLESVRNLAPAATYEVRVYLRLQLAKGYRQPNPTLSRKLLHKAFLDTPAIVDINEKIQMQSEALVSLLAFGSDDVASLLPMAEPAARKDPIREMLQKYIADKRYQSAVDMLLQQASAFDEFPYDLATPLMLHLPREKEADRQTLFSLAFASYRQHTHQQLTVGDDEDFPKMVIRFWRSLPPGMVLEASDDILKQAKDANSGKFSLSSPRGSASFSSLYEIRLFELLPILRELDSSLAEHLISDDMAVKDPLQRFPNGLSSLDPSIRDTPPAKGESSELSESVQMDPPPGGGTSAPPSAGLAAESLVQQIIAASGKGGLESISKALNLPIQAGPFYPRADALAGIAQNNLDASPAVAFHALDELNKTVKDCPPASRARYLLSEGDLLLRAGRSARTFEYMDGVAKAIEEIYEDDSDPGDPNIAPKPYWPSTVIWGRILPVALKMSDDEAGSVIANIHDPEIQMIEKVALANLYLGVPGGVSMIEVKKKNRQSLSTFGQN